MVKFRDRVSNSPLGTVARDFAAIVVDLPMVNVASTMLRLRLRRVNEEDIQVSEALFVSLPMDCCSQLRLVCRLLRSDEGLVFSECFLCVPQDLGQAFLADEHHDGKLGVSPAGVTEELVDGLAEAVSAGPELALADEEVASFVTDEDVRLALVLNASACARPE